MTQVAETTSLTHSVRANSSVRPATATVLTLEKPVAKHCPFILVVLAYEYLPYQAAEKGSNPQFR
jgi:hypothetical protein